MGRISPCLLAATCLLALACGSSSSSSSGSVVGNWTSGSGNTSSTFIFQNGTMCGFDIANGDGGTFCGDCTYTTSGSSLTLTVQTTVDGGQETIVCDCSASLSNGGNTLEVKTKGGTNCPPFDVTVDKVNNGSVAFFCAM
jgi:hypothetical protein